MLVILFSYIVAGMSGDRVSLPCSATIREGELVGVRCCGVSFLFMSELFLTLSKFEKK